jgi:hypothetical protein
MTRNQAKTRGEAVGRRRPTAARLLVAKLLLGSGVWWAAGVSFAADPAPAAPAAPYESTRRQPSAQPKPRGGAAAPQPGGGPTPAAPAPAAAGADPTAAAAEQPPGGPQPPAAEPPAQPPNLARELADLDVGGLRESWSNTPSFVGDGCAPASTSTTVAVGRLLVIAPNLFQQTSQQNGTLQGFTPAQINSVTDGQYNSVQAIKAAGYPAFILPAEPLGTVPGTPPVSLSVGGASPGAGITPVQSPASFTAAVDNTFATNPALDTSQYAGQNPQTVYDAASSGAIGSGSLSGTQDAFLFYNYVIAIDSAGLIPGINVGFTKLVENTSPIPRDRVYFNYSYFHNANITPGRADVNRFVPGFEKTFFDQWTSIEVRTPFAGTLSNVQTVQGGACGGLSEYRDVEFGNMSVVFKSFLMQRETWGISAGMQVLLPTADSVTVNGTDQNGRPLHLVYVENQSVHTMPFVGSVWAPNERWFNQAMIQMDVDSNGSPAYVNGTLQPGISGTQLTSAGRVLYPTFMYLSFSTGYWLYQSNGSGLTGFSPIMEVHVNQAMNEFVPINAYGYSLGNDQGIVSVTNGLIGANWEYNRRSTITIAYVTPLGGGLDRFFDGELRAYVNWRFGRQNRLTRAQF